MFPQKGATVPKLRFVGFAGTWEQRKLEEVAKYRNGKAHENCIDDNGKYIVVNSKFVSTEGEVKKFSNMQNEALFENEIAFVLSDVPNGRAIARTFLVEKSDKYTLNQRIAGITPLNETYPYYLYILMNRHPYFLAFDDGAKQTNLSISDVMEFESYYPIYDEQKKIGKFFRNLDHLITLHQCKLDILMQYKNGFLQQLFI
ncbi:MAG: restriction endonuclease subunit S [Eubacteriales bacterium]|nr:restriction endonuclease subunit S [Eubacteriales bacterium]